MPDATHPPREIRGSDRGRLVAFPGGRRDASPPNNLPSELSSFVGREKELAEVERLLVEGARLITLTGPGGCGKTRLALAVAKDVAGGFEDGVWLVELASLSDPALVAQAVASALKVREAPGRSLTEMLVKYLEPKKTLLVFDNCEHLIEECAALADALLRACPEVRILATSREALSIAGESAWLVPSLFVPDPEQLPPVEELLARYEAIRLFVERAKAVVSTFELTEHNAPVVARLCRRLDGMPLAIELAAARARVLSVEQIASRLDDCFGLLTGGSRTTLPRHQTLRATIGWSYELLSERERVLFRRLSVFAGGLTLEAAAEVCAGENLERDEVLDLLTHLVDKSLVLVAEQRGGEARYRLLETVRQYGLEWLEGSGEAGVILHHRHALWYLALAERAEQGLSGPDQLRLLARLETEHDNLRAALRWSLEGGEAEELGLRLAAVLWSFWYTRGHLSEGRGWLERAISESGPAMTRTKAKALGGAGYIALFQGEHRAAKGFLEEGLALYRELGDKEGIASSLIYLGFVAVLSQRDLETVPALHEEAMGLKSEIEDRRVLANLLLFSGLVAVSQRDMERAIALTEESLALFRQIGDLQGVGHCLNNLGLATLNQADYDRASLLMRENLQIAWESDYKLAIQYSFFGLAGVATSRTQPARAARLWGAAEAMGETSGIQLSPLARSHTNYDGYLAAARAGLDEAAFTAAWAEGRAITPEQAVEYALGRSPHAGTEPLAPRARVTATGQSLFEPLTMRELEVLGLIADGLYNQQIATRLFVALSTVKTYVNAIFRKLEVNNRTQAVAQARRLGLISD